jgi:protein-L-isoaspartate(D-aspartate) O-methyltransferase
MNRTGPIQHDRAADPPLGCAGPGVLSLLAVVKREDFVPPAQRALAFVDTEVPLGRPARPCSNPRVEARLLQELQVQRHEKVLEIGTGSGFMAALLAHRAQRSSRWRPPRWRAWRRENLRQSCRTSSRCAMATAPPGLPAEAPFDAILLSGSVPRCRRRCSSQLKPGGRLLAIVGTSPSCGPCASHASRAGVPGPTWNSSTPWRRASRALRRRASTSDAAPGASTGSPHSCGGRTRLCPYIIDSPLHRSPGCAESNRSVDPCPIPKDSSMHRLPAFANCLPRPCAAALAMGLALAAAAQAQSLRSPTRPPGPTTPPTWPRAARPSRRSTRPLQADALNLPVARAGRHGHHDPPPAGRRAAPQQPEGRAVGQRTRCFNASNSATIDRRAVLAVAQADLEAIAEQDLIVRVSQAYFDVLAAQDALATARQQEGHLRAAGLGQAQLRGRHRHHHRHARGPGPLRPGHGAGIAADNDLRTKRIALDQLVGQQRRDAPLALRRWPCPRCPPAAWNWVAQADRPAPHRPQGPPGAGRGPARNRRRPEAGNLPTVDLVGSLGAATARATGMTSPAARHGTTTNATSACR